MTYTAGIPLPTDIPANSQQQIANNFTVINTYLPTEHTGMNSGADLGKHRFITLKQQSPSAAAPTGTDILLQKALTGNKWYVETIDSTPAPAGPIHRHVPLRNYITVNIPNGPNAHQQLVNFATLGLGTGPDWTSGTILVYPVTVGQYTQHLFGTFTWDGANLYVSAESFRYSGAGAIFSAGLSSSTTPWLTCGTNGGFTNRDVRIIITSSRG